MRERHNQIDEKKGRRIMRTVHLPKKERKREKVEMEAFFFF